MSDNEPIYSTLGIHFGGRFRCRREYGPSSIAQGNVTFSNSTAFRLHRIEGPASIDPHGRLIFVVEGKIHRTDGPAVIYPDGVKEYWIHGEEISQMEFFVRYGTI